MYVVLVKVQKSLIDGLGVFAQADISKGQEVWKYKDGHDVKLSVQEFNNLDPKLQRIMKGRGYLSPTSGEWIFPPKDDPAQYTNHSTRNNLSAVFNDNISPEPYFIANKDIKAGEELTNNYLEFDKFTQTIRPSWL